MSVTAVVVAAAEEFLHHTLVALKEQRFQPERIILVDARPAEVGGTLKYAPDAAGFSVPVELIEARDAANFGVAVSQALGQTDVETEWLWLLHDDSPPLPDALGEQVRATALSRTVGIAGAKQLAYDDPDRILSVGVTYTRAGRRLPEIEPGEIDQGQYDAREDVFAVGTAGMLIRTATWVAMAGTDPALGPFLDSAELCRRVRLAGERIIVVPTAKVRHARAALWHGPGRAHAVADGANSFRARRVATLYYRLLTANLLLLPFVAVAMLIAGVLRGLRRLASNDVGMAGQELVAPILALASVSSIYRGRRQTAKTARVGRGALRELQASRVDVIREWWNRWRSHRLDQRRKVTPSELEIAERRVITRRRRLTFSAVVLGLIGVASPTIIRIFAGGGSFTTPLNGAALGGVDQDYQELWTRFFSGWSAIGDGAPAPQHPFAAVLALLTTLVGGPIGVPSAAVVGILIGGAVPLAGVTAWFGAGAFTRSVTLRAWVALAWALVPVLTQSVSEGRIAAILAHVLLPLFGLALARAFGVDQRDLIRPGLQNADSDHLERIVPALSRASRSPSLGAAAAAGLLLGVIAASAPILAPAGLIVVVLSAVIARRSWLRAFVITAPVIILFLPHIGYGVRHGWGRIFESVDHGPVRLVTFTNPDAPWWHQVPWHTLIGWVGSPPALIISAVVAAFLLILAIIGLFSRGRHATLARWGWAVAAFGLLTTTGSGFVVGAAQYDWLGSLQRLPQWAGSGVSLTSAGMILAASAGMLRIAAIHRVHPNVARKLLTGFGVGGLAATLGLGGISAAVAAIDEPQWSARQVQPLPALARQMVNGPERSRVLMLAPGELAIVADVWRANGPQLLDQPLVLPPEDPARADLQSLAGELFAGEAQELGQRLSAHAVGFVLVPTATSEIVAIDELSREELVSSLDAIGVLERVTQNDSGTLWRVATPAARVMIEQPSGVTVVPATMTGVRVQLPELAGSEAGTLVLAERADPRWRASLNGRPLRSVTVGWQQAFELPAEASGDLRVDYQHFAHRLWRVSLVTVFVLAGTLAIPLRRRAEVV